MTQKGRHPRRASVQAPAGGVLSLERASRRRHQSLGLLSRVRERSGSGKGLESSKSLNLILGQWGVTESA